MKNLMTTTALVLATAMPVAAYDAKSDSVFMNYEEGSASSADLLASDLIGMRVYTSTADIETEPMAEIDSDWDDIGEVSDVIMSRDGKTKSILLDIGGFLGIGEKTVAVNFDELKFIADEDDAGSYFLAFSASQEMLEDAEPFDFDQIGAWTSAKWNEAKATATQTAGSVKQSVTETAKDVSQSAEETAADAKESALATAAYIEQSANEAADDVERTAKNLTAPEISRDGFERFDASELTTEMLVGAPLYDTNDEWIGEVSELIVNEKGELQQAVLDVGGFLGLGEKSVATNMDSLTITRARDGGELRVYVDATKEQLEEMPTYNGS